MKTIFTFIVMLCLGGAAIAADTVSLYGFTPSYTQGRGVMAVVGNVEVSPSAASKADPAIILSGPLRRLTVSDASRNIVSTMTPTEIRTGTFYGSGAGLTALPAGQLTGSLPSSVQVSSAALNLFYSAPAVRNNLGLAIGTNVQGWDADLDDLADGTLSAGKLSSGYPASYIAAGTAGIDISGNAATATAATMANTAAALVSNPSDCALPNVALGIDANGSAVCAQPSTITGNATTVTNGVYTTGLYADPTWITSISGSKVSGNISGNATNITGNLAVSQISAGTAGISITGNAGTASALAANSTNCSAGQAALGVDASGAAEGCWTPSSADNLGNHTATQNLGMSGNDILNADVFSGAALITTVYNKVENSGSDAYVQVGENGIVYGRMNWAVAADRLDINTYGWSYPVAIDGANVQIAYINNSPVYLGSGGVGIGYVAGTPPTSKLGVNGNVVSSGTIYAQNGFYGDGSHLTGINAGITGSTFTFSLGAGGDVFIASGTFAPNLGIEYAVDYSTIYITGVRCYTKIPGSVGPTSFNIARSTDTGSGVPTWSYLFSSSVTVQQNQKYSAWIMPDSNFVVNLLPAMLSLHTVQVPSSGTPPQEYGCIVRYWRRLD